MNFVPNTSIEPPVVSTLKLLPFSTSKKASPFKNNFLLFSQSLLSNSNSEFEQVEDIEILKFLEQGYKVKMLKMSGKSFAIDTNRDLLKARKYLNSKK